MDKTIRAWNLDTNSITALQGHTIMWLSYSTQQHIVFWKYDKTIRAWNLDTNECITTLQGHTVMCLSYSTTYCIQEVVIKPSVRGNSDSDQNLLFASRTEFIH